VNNPELGAVIMVGGAGVTPQERLMLAAQRASTLDLVAVLRAQGLERIIIASPETDWLNDDAVVISDTDPFDTTFHFGERLADLIVTHEIDPVLYFGGGSAPLVDASVASMIIGLVQRAGEPGPNSIPSHIALTNNLHSSDWIAISNIDQALTIIRQTTRDNSLAWLLKASGEYDVRVLSGIRPATSMDLDTPSDLALIARHPDLLPHLHAVVTDPLLAAIPVDALIDVAKQEAKTLAIFGRVSPPAWQALNKVSRIWTRVVAEERGMVASERVERGEVRSVLAPWVKARGVEGFFADLSDMADAVLFDDRVLFAAFGIQPTAADRFASDLLWPEAIGDPWLRDFTQAALNAPIPILLGGHSLVAGGLHVLIEILQRSMTPG